MSIVVVDIDNEYCEDLWYSYQVIKEDDGTYTVYQSRDILRGRYLGRDLETVAEAWQCLQEAMNEYESLEYA